MPWLVKNHPLLIWIILIAILTCLAFWRVTQFGFWNDDWNIFLATQYHPFSTTTHISNHPIGWIETWYLFKLFHWNPLPWQIVGVFLRVLLALSAGLMVLGLTKDKLSAFIASLFIATSPVGLQGVAWSASHSATVVAILECLAVYFWIKNRSLGILVCSLSFLADPGRSIFLLVLIPILEIMLFEKQNSQKTKTQASLVLYPLFAVIFIVINQQMRGVEGVNTYLQNLLGILQNPTIILGYFFSLASLLTFFREIPNGVSQLSELSKYTSTLALIGTFGYLGLLWTSYRYQKSSNSRKALAIFFLTLWVGVAYLPNWLLDTSSNLSFITLVHRYLLVSGIGYLSLLAILVSSIKKKATLIKLITLVVLINIVMSNLILTIYLQTRSNLTINNTWDQIYRDIPRGEQKSIFFYKVSKPKDQTFEDDILENSHGIPVNLREGTNELQHQIISTSKEAVVIYSLCHLNQGLTLSNLHSWLVENNSITDISQQERDYFKTSAKKEGCNLY